MLPWNERSDPLAALLLAAARRGRPRRRPPRPPPPPAAGGTTTPASPPPPTPAPSSSSTAPSGTPSTTGWPSPPTWPAAGYCVFSLDYGQLPGVPLFNGLGPIDKSAEQLQVFVDKVLAATGAAKADLVGHSQGGMMPRYYLKFLGGAAKVNALVGIAPDNHGTTLDGLTHLLPYFPGAEDLLVVGDPGLADQVVGLRLPDQAQRGR